FYPSGKTSRVRSLEAFNRAPQDLAIAGEATGFTLTEQIYVRRGEIAAVAGQPAPQVGTRIRVSLFWLNKTPLTAKKEYVLKVGAARAPFRIETIHRVMDASDLSASDERTSVERHEVAECTLALSAPLAFDTAAVSPATSRFVVVDNFEISGGGIIREAAV